MNWHSFVNLSTSSANFKKAVLKDFSCKLRRCSWWKELLTIPRFLLRSALHKREELQSQLFHLIPSCLWFNVAWNKNWREKERLQLKSYGSPYADESHATFFIKKYSLYSHVQLYHVPKSFEISFCPPSSSLVRLLVLKSVKENQKKKW